MLQRLPAELISGIICDLDQHDLLSLSLVSKRFHLCVEPRLYRAISIDSTKKVYMKKNIMRNAAIPSACNDVSYYYPVKAVIVRSIYCLKVLLRNLRNNPDCCRFVQVLEFATTIPDMPEMELNDAISELIPSFENLKAFNWFNTAYSFNLDAINSLENFKNLVELNGNFKVNSGTLSRIPEKNLNSLHLSAFIFADNLAALDIGKFHYLKDLVISKAVSETKTFEHYVNDGQTGNFEFEEPNYISKLFLRKSISKKLQLTSLVLKDLSLNVSDATLLLKNVHFPCLKELSIINCVELLFETCLEQNNLVRRTPPTSFLLETLQPHLRDLQVLNLDLCNELNYNNKTLNFLSGIQCTLKKLNLNIRFNKFENLNVSLNNVLASLKKHQNELQFFNFNFDVMSGGTTFTAQKSYSVDYSIYSLCELSNFRVLKYLSLPLSQYQIPNLLGILQPLTKLECLKLSLLTETDNTINFNNIGDNSLISKDFFDYSCTMMKTNCCCQLQNYVFDFTSILDNLNWVMFDNGQLDSYVFESSSGQVYLRDSYNMYFDHIVDDLM